MVRRVSDASTQGSTDSSPAARLYSQGGALTTPDWSDEAHERQSTGDSNSPNVNLRTQSSP